jgi:ribosomal biogenesis protein LAS1
MYEKAKQIGLPASFIDIRHDAIHGDLPSLIVLRQAADKALLWLWNDYWKYLAVDTDTLDEDEATSIREKREKLQGEFRRVARAHFAAVPLPSSASLPQDSGSAKAVKQTCLRFVRVCKGEKLALAELVNVLLEDDILIPGSRPQVLRTPQGTSVC